LASLHALLELQTVDLTIDRARARLRSLEAGEDLAKASSAADAAERALGELGLELAALDRDGSRLEHEIDSIRQKAAAEERRLYDGSIANAKELASVQHEVENLKRRISDREDELLAILERREEMVGRATEAERHHDDLRSAADTAADAAADELAEVRSELERAGADRASRAALIDPDILELYEDLRRQKKGIGAAALVDGVCQGCHEQLSAVELDRLKKTEGVPRCEHCRRILIL
jgi:uncharacterized protein